MGWVEGGTQTKKEFLVSHSIFCVRFTFLILIIFFVFYSVDFDRISEQKFRPLKKCAPEFEMQWYHPLALKSYGTAQ